jgi:hypothetical protein
MQTHTDTHVSIDTTRPGEVPRGKGKSCHSACRQDTTGGEVAGPGVSPPSYKLIKPASYTPMNLTALSGAAKNPATPRAATQYDEAHPPTHASSAPTLTRHWLRQLQPLLLQTVTRLSRTPCPHHCRQLPLADRRRACPALPCPRPPLGSASTSHRWGWTRWHARHHLMKQSSRQGA